MVKKKTTKNIDFILDLRDLAIYLNDYEELFNANGEFEDPEEIKKGGLMDGAHISALTMDPLTSEDSESEFINNYSIEYLIKGLNIMKKLGASVVNISCLPNENNKGPITLQYKHDGKKDFYFTIAPRVEEEI